MRTIFVSLFLLITSFNNVSANCIDSYNENGIKIGVIGDSFFTTNPKSCNSFENLLKKKINTNNVQNAAVGGSTVLGFGNKAIKNQKLKFKPDILILSGGGNDLIKCGTNKSCLQQKLNSLLSNDLKSGAYLKLIDKHSSEVTKVFIIYTTVVASHAPKSWKALINSGVGKKFSDLMKNFSSNDENIQWIDAANILDKNNKDHWLKDGFHPSSSGYELIINELSNQIK